MRWSCIAQLADLQLAQATPIRLRSGGCFALHGSCDMLGSCQSRFLAVGLGLAHRLTAAEGGAR